LRALHQAPAAAEPCQRLHHIGGQEQAVDQEYAAEKNRQSAKPLRETPAVEKAGKLAGEPDRRAHRQRGYQAKRQQGGPEEMV
jgi:hypothetical protein